MEQNIKILVYPTKDLAAGKAFFNTFLGTEPYVASDYYVGYMVGELEVGLDPNGQAVVAYIDVDDIKASLQTLLDAGSSIFKDITDVANGLLVAQVKDTNGNVVGLRQQPVK
jgi:predicted enzyme related to lactoylglutathione lyase